jgi:two-component system, chemotaxis family, sensor kinase CheA
MQIRMVPVGPLLRQYERTVRDLAHASGKEAHLIVEDGEVELDTSVVEGLREPLTHMIRNAVDHGLETADERVRQGKDPVGTIRLSARHEDGTVVVSLTDDGRGIDQALLLERAREIGLVPHDGTMSTEALLGLIFEPGFSTRRVANDLSGRGVGMDVVRRTIEALRGTVQVQSEVGHGTTILIRLPLTLAIIDGFAVGIADETYVVPLTSVVECVDLPPERVREGDEAGVLSLRGEPLPYLRLRRYFGQGDRHVSGREAVVVVRHGDGYAGLAVDALHGHMQAVIKPLGKLFADVRGVTGSTILGDGRVALILDVPTLLRSMGTIAAAAA